MAAMTSTVTVGSAQAAARRYRTRRRAVTAMTHAALLIGGLAWLYPLFWALGSSLKGNDDFFSSGLNPLPAHFIWSNYLQAWQEASFGQYFVNTLLITVGTVVVTLVVTSMAGYVLA